MNLRLNFFCLNFMILICSKLKLIPRCIFISLLSNKYSKNIKIQNKFNLSAFKKLYGINNKTIFSFCNKYGLNIKNKNINLKYNVYRKIKNWTNKITFKDTLRNKILDIRNFTVKRLKNYIGARHSLRYPVRGQRTRTNAKTRKRLKSQKLCNLT